MQMITLKQIKYELENFWNPRPGLIQDIFESCQDHHLNFEQFRICLKHYRRENNFCPTLKTFAEFIPRPKAKVNDELKFKEFNIPDRPILWTSQLLTLVSDFQYDYLQKKCLHFGLVWAYQKANYLAVVELMRQIPDISPEDFDHWAAIFRNQHRVQVADLKKNCGSGSKNIFAKRILKIRKSIA